LSSNKIFQQYLEPKSALENKISSTGMWGTSGMEELIEVLTDGRNKLDTFVPDELLCL
jgi:hypothetical protein